ncbi:Ankyrin repeat and BTB/POZ domain-containing protein 1 [Hypsibius exemplaris]|uniref:Ankyrin repeat and BTB/POZ domain-containing protein 1 n=1 Tax=Hypsibius exemplaris TaxID=2072580 RepID=A0A9X6NGD2_HYPEX|nr:Ankyrin repeat and BTB/POZ domain-containing protein 1 [Hypsibius exemplaris]
MDQNELFSACRHGYLEKLRQLVEERDVELNVRDVWDSTPLYYACLCGHEEVVLYLLEKGARCDPDTFDGERCLYGSLTTKIRQLLVQHKAITSQVIRRNPYDGFLRSLLDNLEFSDVTFVVHGETFRFHRCVLAARSRYFYERFASKWKHRDVIRNNHPLVDPDAFRAVMEYIYTGRLQIDVGLVDDCLRLARQFGLDTLDARLNLQKAQATFFVKTKFTTRIANQWTTLVVEPQIGSNELHYNFGNLARHAIPDVGSSGDVDDLSLDEDAFWSGLSDVIFDVEQKRFRCHKVFVCNRSEYLRALVTDHFHESVVTATGIPVIKVGGVTADIFRAVVQFIYQDFVTDLTAENVLDLLDTAELYLLPGLKKQCATVIAANLDRNCVIPILRTARALQLPRLQAVCVQFVASHIELLVREPELKKLIAEDAAQVSNREDTDTIEVVDDIRCCITNNLQTLSQTEEAHARLLLIDALLQELGLDA